MFLFSKICRDLENTVNMFSKILKFLPFVFDQNSLEKKFHIKILEWAKLFIDLVKGKTKASVEFNFIFFTKQDIPPGAGSKHFLN